MENPCSSVQHFLDDTFIDTVLKHTNEELKRRRERHPQQEKICHNDFQVEEMKACIGLLILSGVLRSRGESLEQMWSVDYGRPIMRATMPLKRFMMFLACARFDDKSTRIERQK